MKPNIQYLQNLVLKYLNFRPRSRSEVVNYLSKKTNNPDEVSALVSKFEKLKLIDDKAFAKWYIDSRSRSSPRGNSRLSFELKNFGIKELPISNTTQEIGLAKVALEKKQRSWPELSPQDFRNKATRFLSYRGFSYQTIVKVLKNGYNEDN